jgi:peptide/nickel transport system substrate-binding protein
MTPKTRAIVLLLLAVVPCLPAADAPVVYLRFADAATLDPGRADDFYSQEVTFNVFEGLVRLRADRLEAEPCLAERWETHEDGRRWTFFLRRGVKFHDGQPFDSRAVVHSFAMRLAGRSREYAAFGRIFPQLREVRARGEFAVDFLLSRPSTQFLLALVDPRGGIAAPGAVTGPRFRASGTGPFTVTRRPGGRIIVLERFPGYWGGPARLARIIFRYEPSTALRISQVRNHGADLVFIRSAKEHDEFLGRNDLEFISEPRLSTQYLGFNCRRPPFSSRLVRQAVFHLLNRTVLVKQVFQRFAMPASGMLPPRMPGYDPGVGPDDFSLDKARRLLEKSGWGRGFRATLYYPEGQFGIEDLAQALIANARLVGVTIRPVTMPVAAVIRAVQDGVPDLFTLGWGYTADPAVFLNPLFLLHPGAGSRTLSAGPEFSSLLERVETTVDPGRRGELIAAAQRLLQEQLPVIPLFYLNHVLAHSARLRGLRLDPFGFILFREASLSPE